MIQKIDVASNRGSVKWTRREQAGRLAWAVVSPLFFFSPRPLWVWRCVLLRLFGASVGADVHIYPSVRIAIPWKLSIGDESAIGDRVQIYNLGPIAIGSQVTISQNAHLCAGTHDHRDPTFPLVKSPITIGDRAWICADAFVGPGVSIGEDTILGARAVAMRDLPPGVIAAGHPATILKRRGMGPASVE